MATAHADQTPTIINVPQEVRKYCPHSSDPTVLASCQDTFDSCNTNLTLLIEAFLSDLTQTNKGSSYYLTDEQVQQYDNYVKASIVDEFMVGKAKSCKAKAKAFCGNGVIENQETCDGATLPPDAEAGSRCDEYCILHSPSKAFPSTCGNGRIEGKEGCDGKALPASAEAGSWCDDGCILHAPTKQFPTSEICGDGKIAGKEECDDFNKEDGDGCNSSCQLEDLTLQNTKKMHAPSIESQPELWCKNALKASGGQPGVEVGCSEALNTCKTDLLWALKKKMMGGSKSPASCFWMNLPEGASLFCSPEALNSLNDKALQHGEEMAKACSVQGVVDNSLQANKPGEVVMDTLKTAAQGSDTKQDSGNSVDAGPPAGNPASGGCSLAVGSEVQDGAAFWICSMLMLPLVRRYRRP